MQYLKQSTAKIFRIGPFVDSTDGVTAKTGLSIAQADIQISKDGGAFAQTSASSPTTTHDADGWYQCPLTATDTVTLGPLTVQVTMSGALPVWRHFTVVAANVYDSMVAGTDNLDVTLANGAHGGADAELDLKRFTITGTGSTHGFRISNNAGSAFTATTTNASSSAVIFQSLSGTAFLLNIASNVTAARGLRITRAGSSGKDLEISVSSSLSDAATDLLASLRLSNAILFGKLSGARTGTETFLDAADGTTPRVVSTVDSSGNRTAVTLTP